MGCSLQPNRKTKEGPQHANRDAQFRYINRQVKALVGAGDPVISVDAKKKELVVPFKNAGRTWRPKGKPQEVNSNDFPGLAQGKALPYGVYDSGQNRALVNVRVTHDTAEFAVESIRRTQRVPRKLDGQKTIRRRGDYSSAPMLGEQRKSASRVEAQPAVDGRSDPDTGHRLSLPSGNQQLEQDRAPAILVYRSELEGRSRDR
jgi:hypothetical protein